MKCIEVTLLAHGGVCKNVIDILSDTNVSIVNICDDNVNADFGDFYSNFSCNDTIKSFVEKSDSTMYFFNCIGNIKYFNKRIEYLNVLRNKGLNSINVIHKMATMSSSVNLGDGNLFLSGCTIGPDVHIGNDCIFFTNTIVEHDCRIGNNCYFSPSVTLCGKINIGNNVYVGPGVVVGAGASIGDNAILGAGSVVLSDVPSGQVFYGTPAKFVKQNIRWK